LNLKGKVNKKREKKLWVIKSLFDDENKYCVRYEIPKAEFCGSFVFSFLIHQLILQSLKKLFNFSLQKISYLLLFL
jgi:hypothetical protein